MRAAKSRTRTTALLLGRALVLVLVGVSCRAAYAPLVVVHKSEQSRRPKFPKKVVRVEEFRVSAEEKQNQSPKLPHPQAAPRDLEREIARVMIAIAPDMPLQAFLQLTKPDYLQSYATSSALLAHAPPA